MRWLKKEGLLATADGQRCQGASAECDHVLVTPSCPESEEDHDISPRGPPSPGDRDGGRSTYRHQAVDYAVHPLVGGELGSEQRGSVAAGSKPPAERPGVCFPLVFLETPLGVPPAAPSEPIYSTVTVVPGWQVKRGSRPVLARNSCARPSACPWLVKSGCEIIQSSL